MKVYTCKQGSPEWHALRRGIPTASEMGRIMTPKTMALSSAADGYIAQLVAERLSTIPPEYADSYTNKPMEWGRETEMAARRWYEMEIGVQVQEIGFCTSDDGRFGCSPDGLVGEKGGLELKCPQGKAQIKYCLDDRHAIPSEYMAQVHGALLVSGRPFWDFLSYSPGCPTIYVRAEPSIYTMKLATALEEFLERFDEALAKIKGML